MNYEIVTVDVKDKDKLYRLLQYALYDGSQYIDNGINTYFIKNGKNYLGMVLVNENLKFNNKGKCIAEFLIMPRFRRNHIGKKVAYEIFEMFKGDWEVQPMENNPTAYSF